MMNSKHRFCGLLILATLFGTVTGCSSFGNGKLVQELRNENERLLSEFRAERERRKESEQILQLTRSRLEESEKLLARQHQGSQQRGQLSGFMGATGLQKRAQQPLGQQARAQVANLPGGTPIGPGGLGPSDPVDDSGLRWQRRPNP